MKHHNTKKPPKKTNNKNPKIEYILFSQNYFAHNLKRGNFFGLLFFFFKQECIVFTFGGKKLCFHFTKSIMTEHRRTAILHIFFLAIFFFLHSFSLTGKKKKS